VLHLHRIRCELSKKVSEQLRFRGWSCQRQSHRREVPTSTLFAKGGAPAFLPGAREEAAGRAGRPSPHEPLLIQRAAAIRWRNVRFQKVSYALVCVNLIGADIFLSGVNFGAWLRQAGRTNASVPTWATRSVSSRNPLAVRALSESRLRACMRRSGFRLLRSRGLRSHRLCIRPRRRVS
jgi:hypothetical protein